MRTPVIRNPDYPKDLWTNHAHAYCTLPQKRDVRVKSETISKLATEYSIENSVITKKDCSFVTTTECQCSHDRKKGHMPGE